MKYILLFITIILTSAGFANASQIALTPIQEKLATLEKQFAGEIGVYAINTNNDQIIAYRADQRFPLQSTLKLIAVAALLKQSERDQNLLQKNIYYTKDDLVVWHPITGKYVTSGMTLAALAEAAMIYSDNPAINLIIKKLGGPRAVTHFARSIGNNSFNLVHYEGQLNSTPNHSADTVTPKDMAISLQKLILGNILKPEQSGQLLAWMKNSVTGYQRIRAAVPADWGVADKTGSGDYGIANHVGVLWPPACKPIVLAIYTVQYIKNAKSRDDIVAATTKIILDDFAKNHDCVRTA